MLAIGSPVRMESPTATRIQLLTVTTIRIKIRDDRLIVPLACKCAAVMAPKHAYAAAVTALPPIGQRPRRTIGIAKARPTIVESSGPGTIAAVPRAIAERVRG